MALKRLFQVIAAEESQAGEAVANLLSPTNANYLVIDPELSINPETFERGNINRSSLSPLPPLAGVVTGTFRFQLELTGVVGGASVVPRWGLLLEACGMREVVHDQYTAPVITGGPFYQGEALTGTSGDGICIGDTWAGASALYVEPGSAPLTGTITGAESGATATFTAVNAAQGYSYVPISIETITFDVASITGTIGAGDALVGQTSGAVLVPAANVTGAGSFEFRVLDGIVQDGETFDNVTQTGTMDVDTPGNYVMTQIPTLSMALIEDATAKVLRGCRGTFSMSGEIGQAVTFQFEFQGILGADPSDTGALAGVQYTSVTPPVLLGSSFLFGDATTTDELSKNQPRYSSFTIDYANTVGLPRDASEGTGVYDSAHVTSRASTGAINVKVAPEASFDFLKKLKDGTPANAVLNISGGTSNFQVSTPGLISTSEGAGEDTGFATRDLSFSIASIRPDTGAEVDHAELVITSY